MQLDRLYPTDVTDQATGISFSAFTEDIDGIAENMADAYLMGYLPPEMVAPPFRPVLLSGGGDSVTAVYDYSQNYGWGYIFRQSSPDGTGGVNYVDQNGVYRRLYNVNPDYRFINSAEMSKYCTDNNLTINIAALVINKNYWDSGKMATTQMIGYPNVRLIVNTQQTYTFSQWRDIIKSDTVFYSKTVDGYTIELRPSDFGDSNDPDQLHVKFFESGNYIIRADIYDYVIGGTHYTNLTGGGYSNLYISPFVQAKIRAAGLPETVADVIPGTALQHPFYVKYNNGVLSFARGEGSGTSNNYDYIPDYDVTFGGFNNGTVSVSDIDFTTASNQNYFGLVRNWYFNYQNGNFRIIPTFTPLDIYHHMMLFHKHTNAPSGGYTTADTVTVFTSDDTPTMDTVSGSLSDIIASLRPWQIPNVDITSNVFTPEDIPDPDPDPGSEDTGDSITRPSAISVGGTNGFVTQYVLTASQIAALGRGLWAGVADRAFWDNWLWTALLEAGTFNVSDILQFFISLRVYPFSLINVSSYQGTGSAALWLGRGTKAIDLGTQDNLGTISQYADILDAGSLTVPAYYGDFRDYDHVSITLHAPYIGTINLAPGDVVGAAIHLFYAIDFASGACTAYLDISRGGIQYPICIGSGVIGADVPLSADSAARRVAAAIDLGFDTVAGISAVFSGDPLSAAGAAANMAKQQPTIPTLSATGKGFDSFAGAQTAYIQIRRGKYAEGKTPGSVFKSTYGDQLDQPAVIGTLAGFTKFVNVDTAGLHCDAAERSAILTQLQSGVYI